MSNGDSINLGPVVGRLEVVGFGCLDLCGLGFGCFGICRL